jgi:hypothetical protein
MRVMGRMGRGWRAGRVRVQGLWVASPPWWSRADPHPPTQTAPAHQPGQRQPRRGSGRTMHRRGRRRSQTRGRRRRTPRTRRGGSPRRRASTRRWCRRRLRQCAIGRRGSHSLQARWDSREPTLRRQPARLGQSCRRSRAGTGAAPTNSERQREGVRRAQAWPAAAGRGGGAARTSSGMTEASYPSWVSWSRTSAS